MMQQLSSTIEEAFYDLAVQHLDINNVSRMIASYAYPDISFDDVYASSFSINDQRYKIQHGWFVPDHNPSNTQNVCNIVQRQLGLKRIHNQNPAFDPQLVYEMATNRDCDWCWYKDDILFGLQSTFKNQEGKIVEFQVVNENNFAIGRASTNGLVSFLSIIDPYILRQKVVHPSGVDGVYRKSTSRAINFIPHANHLQYDTFFLRFDEPIQDNSGCITYFGDAGFVPNGVRSWMTEEIVLDDVVYIVDRLHIVKRVLVEQ
jgi:hypothetical protein